MGTERLIFSYHAVVGYADHQSPVTSFKPALIWGEYSCLGFLFKAEV